MKIKIAIVLLAGLLIAAGKFARRTPTHCRRTLSKSWNSLKYQQGEINLKDGLATLNVPADFNYLGPDDAETVLVKLWGNPPSQEKPLGLLIPAGMTPASSNAWVVTDRLFRRRLCERHKCEFD